MATLTTPEELDERTRCAWLHYSERLRDLDGRDYEDAERDSWAFLQATLRDIEEERGALGTGSD